MWNNIGDMFIPSNESAKVEKLEAGTYSIRWSQNTGYFLARAPELKLPEKVYGHNQDIVDKVLKLFADKSGVTSAVMLYGVKGTGKTLTAVGVCNDAIDKAGIPVLLLKDKFYGSDFNDFIASIDESCVVFVDEFEKVFDDAESMKSTLMLLDGAVKSHKLFVLTSNKSMKDAGNMEFLDNRPSRVFYSIEYGTMTDEVLQEYLDDNLKYPQYRTDLFGFKRSFQVFTMDMLKSVVEEVNRYGHTGKGFGDMVFHLNVRPDRGLADYIYDGTVTFEGETYNWNEVVGEHNSYMTGMRLKWFVEDGDDSHMQFYAPLNGRTVEQMREQYPRTGQFRISSDGYIKDGTLFVEAGSSRHSEMLRKMMEAKGEPVPEGENIEPTHVKVIVYLDDVVESDMYIVTQDEKTRAITISTATEPKVSFTWTPRLQPQEKVKTFFI